jgi:hypothetical protein
LTFEKQSKTQAVHKPAQNIPLPTELENTKPLPYKKYQRLERVFKGSRSRAEKVVDDVRAEGRGTAGLGPAKSDWIF